MIQSERHIEMLWGCTSCQHKNLGRFKTCQSCANPKDGSEEYEMPEDTSKAATVTDEALLRMATAGPNWRCAYCQSDQRRLDMGCGNCGVFAVEGAEVPDASVNQLIPDDEPTLQVRSWSTIKWVLIGILSVIVLFIGFGVFLSWNQNCLCEYKVIVSVLCWERDIAVERYQYKVYEGFKETLPEGALEIRSIGKQVHHHEQVLDHYDDERYSVEVSDGYRTESYIERVFCGRDCTIRSQSCREKCSSNKNGFAICRIECSGGGESCTTRYCNESCTRQVPKTRIEWRMCKVLRYCSEPRYAEGFAYKRWEWLPERKLHAEGDAVPAKWPEANLGKDLGPGEKEREQRSESYKVTIVYDKEKHSFDFVPLSDAEFARFPRLSEHRLHTENGQFTLNGTPIKPTRVF